MLDLIQAKECIPFDGLCYTVFMQVLKDVGELLNHTLNQAQTRQSLSGSTVFNRIEIPTTSDPLNGD